MQIPELEGHGSPPIYVCICICLHKGPAVLPGTSMHNRTFSDMIIHDQDFQEASYETP